MQLRNKEFKFIRRTGSFSRRVFLTRLEIELTCSFQKLKNDPKFITSYPCLVFTRRRPATLGSDGLSGSTSAGISLLSFHFILSSSCYLLFQCQLLSTSYSQKVWSVLLYFMHCSNRDCFCFYNGAGF